MTVLGYSAFDNPDLALLLGQAQVQFNFSFQLVESAIVAAGTTLATGKQLNADVSSIGTVTSGTGVVLKDTYPGRSKIVANLGAASLLVYPPTASEIINAKSAGAGITLTTSQIAVFTKIDATHWIAYTATQSS